MPALQAQLLDVRAGSFGDPQAVQGKEGDQRMLGRRPEPGGHEHGAELVAVQRDRVGPVVDPRPPDVCGRGVLEEFFFDGVLVEPGKGAQPPGDGGAGTAACFQIPGEAFVRSRSRYGELQVRLGAGRWPCSYVSTSIRR